jgi:cellulose biosynthesis protein BcsQ
MSSSAGSPTTRIPRALGESTAPAPNLDTVETSKQKPAKAKVPFEKKLPVWVVAGKPRQAGLLRGIWWLYAKLHLYKVGWVPMPPEYLFYEVEIRQLSRAIQRRRQFISDSLVTIATKKGGAGKTTVASWLMATLGAATKATVGGFDLEGEGKLAQRFNIDPQQTLKSDTFVRLASDDDTQRFSPEYAALMRQMPADEETGVVVVHSDARPNGDFSGVATQRALMYFSPSVFMTIVDTPPTFNHHSTRGALGVSQVRVVVGLASQGETLEDIKQTLEHRPYRLGDHLEQVVVVISGVRRRNLNARTRYQFANRYGVTPEQVVLVPFARYLEKKDHPDENKAKPRFVSLSAIDPRTKYAWYQLADVVTQRVASYNLKHPKESFLLDTEVSEEEYVDSEELQDIESSIGDSTALSERTAS